MARALYCAICDADVAIVEDPTRCATCQGPVVWHDTPDLPFTLTRNDRLFLSRIGIGAQ